MQRFPSVPRDRLSDPARRQPLLRLWADHASPAAVRPWFPICRSFCTLVSLSFKTNYQLFAALQQGNCAMHARQIHTPLTRSVNRRRSRERATDGGRKIRPGPEQDPEEACPRDLVRGANGLPKRSCSTKKI